MGWFTLFTMVTIGAFGAGQYLGTHLKGYSPGIKGPSVTHVQGNRLSKPTDLHQLYHDLSAVPKDESRQSLLLLLPFHLGRAVSQALSACRGTAEKLWLGRHLVLGALLDARPGGISKAALLALASLPIASSSRYVDPWAPLLASWRHNAYLSTRQIEVVCNSGSRYSKILDCDARGIWIRMRDKQVTGVFRAGSLKFFSLEDVGVSCHTYRKFSKVLVEYCDHMTKERLESCGDLTLVCKATSPKPEPEKRSGGLPTGLVLLIIATSAVLLAALAWFGCKCYKVYQVAHPPPPALPVVFQGNQVLLPLPAGPPVPPPPAPPAPQRGPRRNWRLPNPRSPVQTRSRTARQ